MSLQASSQIPSSKQAEYAVHQHGTKQQKSPPHNGSIFSIIFRLLSLELSACLKNLKSKVLYVMGVESEVAAEAGAAWHLVPPWSELNQPFRVDGDALVHVPSSMDCYCNLRN
jgi:hypothetical protein